MYSYDPNYHDNLIFRERTQKRRRNIYLGGIFAAVALTYYGVRFCDIPLEEIGEKSGKLSGTLTGLALMKQIAASRLRRERQQYECQHNVLILESR